MARLTKKKGGDASGARPEAVAGTQPRYDCGQLAIAAMDGLSANVAILDNNGVILAVNQAWKSFAQVNGLPRGTDFVGENYLELCERSAGGEAAANGLRGLLAGGRQEFYLEYPCHGRREPRWFGMRATPLKGGTPARIVVAHENITDRKLAEQALRQAHDQLESRVRERTEELAKANRDLSEQIDERQTSDAVLRESNERLQLALRAGMTGIWQINLDTGVVTRSDSTDLLFGLDPGGRSRPLKDYTDRMHPDDVLQVEQTIARSVEEGGEQFVEYRVLLPDGQTRWIASRGQTWREGGAGALVMVGASVDITRRKLTEDALRDSEERYRLLFESNPHPMWVYELASLDFLAVNDAAVHFYGYSREQFLAMSIRDIRPVEEVKRIETFIQNHGKDQDAKGIWKHRKKDGTIVSVEVISHTLVFAGRETRLILANDVTDRLVAEEGLRKARVELEERVRVRTAELARSNDALRESEELFRQIAENIGEVFWMTDTQKSRMIYISPAYETIWGRSCQSLYERPISFLDAIVDEDRYLVVKNIPRQAQGETTITYRVRAGDATVHWIRDRSFPIRNRAGRVYRVAGIAENITDLKKTEEELSRLASIAESSDDAIIGKSPDGRILSWNSGARRIYGYAADEMLGQPVAVLMPVEQCGEATELLARVARGEQVASFETTRVRKNGERFSVSLTLSAVRDAAGRLFAISAIERDVTDRKRLEREILEIGERERQRIGQDLHDGLGQHLTGIAFLSKALQQQLTAGEHPEATDAGQIADLVQQAIGQTRALARGLHPVQSSPSGLMSALREMANRVEAVFRVRCSFACPRPVLVSDNNIATHLYRIAQEAINNAIKHGSARRIRIALGGSRRIALRIVDDGRGFDPEAVHVEVDLSGNAPPGQSGLGLRIMTYRARMIGATFSVGRGAAGGTTVTCILPPCAAISTNTSASTSTLPSNSDGEANGYQRPPRSDSTTPTRRARRRNGQGKGPSGG